MMRNHALGIFVFTSLLAAPASASNYTIETICSPDTNGSMLCGGYYVPYGSPGPSVSIGVHSIATGIDGNNNEVVHVAFVAQQQTSHKLMLRAIAISARSRLEIPTGIGPIPVVSTTCT